VTVRDDQRAGGYNAYLFFAHSDSGRRVIIAENVSYAEAERACKAQLLYLPKVGRIGDCWYGAGLMPRLDIVAVETEPVEFYSANPIYLDDLLAGLSAKYEKR
jgi:hypothetical protein